MAEPELKFEEKGHRYFLDGRRYPCVTDILKESAVINMPPGVDMTEAMHRGRYVHAACDLLNNHNLKMETLIPRYTGYVRAWALFLKEAAAGVIASESRVYSKKWQYAGTVDSILQVNKGIALVDIKTGERPEPFWQLQTAGYKIAWEEMYGQKINQRLAVMLRADGTYKKDSHVDPGDINQFLGFVSGYAWKLNKRIITLPEESYEE